MRASERASERKNVDDRRTGSSSFERKAVCRAGSHRKKQWVDYYELNLINKSHKLRCFALSFSLCVAPSLLPSSVLASPPAPPLPPRVGVVLFQLNLFSGTSRAEHRAARFEKARLVPNGNGSRMSCNSAWGPVSCACVHVCLPMCAPTWCNRSLDA